MSEVVEIDTGAFYDAIPRTDGEFQLYLKERAEAKARYCKRERHRNANPERIGGIYVALCAKCREELSNYLLEIVNRHRQNFKLVIK